MRKCVKCGFDKDEKEFYKPSNGKNQTYCKACNLIDRMERIRKFKYDCVQYKGGKCVVCSYNKSLCALEFHHRDPTQKDYGISQLRSTSFLKNPQVKDELDKCDLVCSNCHREIHEKLVIVDFNKSIKQRIIYLCECGNKKSRGAIQCLDCRIKNKTFKPPIIPKQAKEISHCSCGRQKCSVATECLVCHKNNVKTKIDWPLPERMGKWIWEEPTTQIALKLGVSDKAIDKFCKKNGINKPSRGYWAKLHRDLIK